MKLPKHSSRRGIFETLKIFDPPKGDARAYPVGTNCFYSYFNCCLGNVYDTLKTCLYEGLIFPSKWCIVRMDGVDGGWTGTIWVLEFFPFPINILKRTWFKPLYILKLFCTNFSYILKFMQIGGPEAKIQQ